jgi:hypothetical protein
MQLWVSKVVMYKSIFQIAITYGYAIKWLYEIVTRNQVIM